ncbi:hypothetical protein [Candidatus Similichlamydia epinepheli]|uniref:hypothetical protein n=1 Tax=Candidatus Similichlamydia epinepheli TaxID=1903953 RepID=UPI000D34FF0A|nr:hypothetical protein [Candidatus Similichlamydia epinepheli]
MSSVPELLKDPSLLRLGFVLLGSVVARLFSQVQLLGGQYFGRSICYEFVTKLSISDENLVQLEEVFRQLCSTPPSFRQIRQPKSNFLLWAKETGQSLLCRLFRGRDLGPILEMVETDGRYEFVGGPVASEPSSLRHVKLELEQGFSSHLPTVSCYRLKAVFPKCEKQRKLYVKQEKKLAKRAIKSDFFLYQEEHKSAFPLEAGALFLQSLFEWFDAVFKEEGFLYSCMEPSPNLSSDLRSSTLDRSFFSSHLSLWETQGRRTKWSTFTSRFVNLEAFSSSSAWWLFSLTSAHTVFASSFCTKQDLVLELQRAFRIVLRLVSSFGLNVSFCFVSSPDLSRGELQGLWSRIGFLPETVECLGVDSVSEYSWVGFDCVGRTWPLGRVRISPLFDSVRHETVEQIWWVCLEPLYSLEGLYALFSFGGADSIFSLPRDVRLFTSEERLVPLLAFYASKLEKASLSVELESEVVNRDLLVRKFLGCQLVCLHDMFGRSCSVWDGREENVSCWREESLNDFTLRNYVSLLVETMRRKTI